MTEEHVNYTAVTSGARTHPPDYHVMVLLVDDQAMVCEAVRRALANHTDIDFHYCPEAKDAITIANQIKCRSSIYINGCSCIRYSNVCK